MTVQKVDEIRSRLAVLVALHGGDNRAELSAKTSLSPSTVGAHVDHLIQQGVLAEVGAKRLGGRGRPIYQLAMNNTAGVVLVAELGAVGAMLAVGDLSGRVLASELADDIEMTPGPGEVLEEICARLLDLLHSLSLTESAVRAFVIALPGPIDDVNGTVVRPTLLPGWDGYPIASELHARFGWAVELHNDANMMAAGEALALTPAELPMVFLKIGSGIGCGVVLEDGSIFQGKDGSAGDIAHTPASGSHDVLCGCGRVGCLEAVTSTRAILGKLRGDGAGFPFDPYASRKLAKLLEEGDPSAVLEVRRAAEIVGDAAALLVQIINPATVVIGGLVAAASDTVIASVRGRVYQSSQPLAVRSLVIRPSLLGEKAGVTGALRRAVEIALAPERIAALGRTPAAAVSVARGAGERQPSF
ncbi:ROK family transcriptional regulator [Pseudarthrobacter sp. NIBRBAC000502770]|uniref:ROK family transcriptional regulator n=1 Tax=Pseudarthrobacter sp. NIBRBAC000502770 TaxID=2590785 RepID=UPI00113FE284|nr:ROK family protein [Pseudarthrobacter sp. NIBRBAC000502770]QDG88191.1 ROK family protein [Pseudarthrobacter sp. NIBRBAC000502770]